MALDGFRGARATPSRPSKKKIQARTEPFRCEGVLIPQATNVPGGRFGQGQAMSQQLQARQFRTSQFKTSQCKAWRSGDGEKLWLSRLVDTMEKLSREKLSRRAVPCDRSVLAALTAQLARPASPYPHCRSHFSLRN